MRPCDIYAKELSTLFRGHAVHNPRRSKLQSGLGPRPPVRVGDVVYDLEGQLIRIFNCLLPPGEQDVDCRFPHDFEVLDPSRWHGDVWQQAPITVVENHHRPGPFYSEGVSMLDVEAGISMPLDGGASIAFSARHEQGAVLLTSSRVTSRQSPNRPLFERYMIKHYDSWCSLLQSLGLEVRPEDLMFITAVESTQAWSNVVFTRQQLRGTFSVEVPTLSSLGGRLSGGVEYRRTQSATRDSGPNPEDMEIGHTVDAGHTPDIATLGTTDDDQVIFIRALRGKKRRFMGLKIMKAGAEPEDSDGGPPSDSDSSDLSLESVEGLQPREDYLAPILSFILENSAVDIALAHDDDYPIFHQLSRESSSTSLGDRVARQSEDGITFGTYETLSVQGGVTESPARAVASSSATPASPSILQALQRFVLDDSTEAKIRARKQHQPFLPPNQNMVRQMQALQQQNTPLHQQQAGTMQLLSQRFGHAGPQQPHLGQPHQQPHQPQGQAPSLTDTNIIAVLLNSLGQPQQQRIIQQIVENLPRMRPEELISFARQCLQIEGELSTRLGELQNALRGGANQITTGQELGLLQKKSSFVQNFGTKIQQEIMARKDKGQFNPQLLGQIPPPVPGPLPSTLPNGMTNPDWLKAHGAPPDLFTNGAYPQHEVQAAVELMRQSIINQGAGPQRTQSQLQQLSLLQQQHAARAPSTQQGPGPNPATPGPPHASSMPQPASVNPQQAPPQQPGGPGQQQAMTADNIAARLRQVPPCPEEMFNRMWPAWVKNAGLSLSQDDISPPETLQGKPSISLWRLHSIVWQVGGHDAVGDRWAQLAGMLGWGIMKKSAGPLAQPMGADRLRQHHATYLKGFDTWYHNLQRQRMIQHVQNQQAGAQRATRAALTPERLQQAISAAVMNASAVEMRSRGVGEDIIQYVETNREALLQKHREQMAFKQGLKGPQHQQQGQPHPLGQQQQQANGMHPNPQQRQMNGGPQVNGMGGNMVIPPQPVPQGQPPQLFGPLPAARDLKGVDPDGSIDQATATATLQSIHRMRKNLEPQFIQQIKHIEPPVDVDKNEWTALLERGSMLAGEIEKTLPTFIAYTQGPNQQLGAILSKYVGQIMTVTFQKRILQQHPPRYIVDLNQLRGFVQQFSNLLVILRNRITAVRLELQQLHGMQPRPASTQQQFPGPLPPGTPQGHIIQQQLAVPGQQQPYVLSGQQPPTGRVPTPQDRVPTPHHRVPTPMNCPPMPVNSMNDQMPPPLPPNVAASQNNHQRKVGDAPMPSPAANSPHMPATANAASPQMLQTQKNKPKPKPKIKRRQSAAAAAAAAAEETTDVAAAESSTASTSTAAPKAGNKRPREEDTAAPVASSKRTKTDWEGPLSNAQEQRAKAAEEAEEAPKDDEAASEFVDDMMRQFAQSEGDAMPLVSGINAILATVIPGAAGADGAVGSGGLEGDSTDILSDDLFDFSQYLDFDAGLGTGTVDTTPELVHGFSTNPSPDSGSEVEGAANAAPASSASDKTPGSLDLGSDALDDSLHISAWSEIDGGETSYYHGGVGWRWDAPMPTT